MPIWDHIRELIKRMKWVVIIFIVSSLVALAVPIDLGFLKNTSAYNTPAIWLLKQMLTLKPPSLELLSISMTAPLELWVIAAFVMGALVTAPVFAYEFYAFVDPALYPSERKAVYPVVLSFTVLFMAGCIFAWFFLIPLMFAGLMPFFVFVGAKPAIAVLDYYNLVMLFVVLSGLSFTLPVFFVLLVRFHILRTSLITKNRRYYYAGLYILAALITPDGGAWADFIMFLPLAALTEIAILIAKRYEKAEEKEAAAPATAAVPAPPARCKYCGHELEKGNPFCPNCKRSQV
ncbi:MAG TPA: twin-arginine translocase subunit TatC [Conexivisphaerales archaeon]|nr:twin-arginine translocase subunit TatC [Conexivisphaerales archaeon]